MQLYRVPYATRTNPIGGVSRRLHCRRKSQAVLFGDCLSDPSNPRSLAASVERLVAHAQAGEWAVGEDVADEMSKAIALPVDDLVVAVRPLVEEAGRRIVSRWFSTPVNPIVMRQREGSQA